MAEGVASAYHFDGAGDASEEEDEAHCRGPQCSSFPDEFCFFCAYERDPNAEHGTASDLYGSLQSLVETMSSQSREFPAITAAVHSAYRVQIQHLISDPVFGTAPAWSRKSIIRHLTYSNQFKGVFRAGVTQIFHSLVDAHNRNMKDRATGQIIESERVALMSTLATYMKWEAFSKQLSK